MRLTMLKNQKGSEDGITVKQFIKNETYEVADNLAEAFLEMGVAHTSDSNSSNDQNEQEEHLEANQKADKKLRNKMQPSNLKNKSDGE